MGKIDKLRSIWGIIWDINMVIRSPLDLKGFTVFLKSHPFKKGGTDYSSYFVVYQVE